MSDLSLIIIGAGIGLVCSILGGVVGAWVSYRFRLKEEVVKREIARRKEEEQSRLILRSQLRDLDLRQIGSKATIASNKMIGKGNEMVVIVRKEEHEMLADDASEETSAEDATDGGDL